MSSRRDIEAASAYVRLYTKGAEWSKGLHRAGEQLTDFGQRINNLAKKLAIAGGAIAAPLVASIKAYVDLGSELQDVSDRVGIQVDALSELRFAADQSGSNITALEKTLRKMQVAIAEAANGSKTAKQSLAALGLESKDFIGLSADQQFEKIADALASIPDTGDRIATAMDLMGKSAAELMPLFDQGADGIRALRQQAKDLGLSIDPKQAATAEALGDAFSIVGKVVHRLAFAIGAALGPAMKDLAAWITKIVIAAREWVDQNKEAVVAIAKLAVGIFIVAGALATVGGAIQFVGFSLFGLATITKAVSIAFLAMGKIAAIAIAAVTSPIGIAVTLLAGLAGYALYASGALSTLAQGWSALGETANAAWTGIVAAVAGGDLALAGEIAMTSLEIAWMQLTGSMHEAWLQFVDYLYQPWQTAVDWITDRMVDGFAVIQTAWLSITSGIMSVWDSVVGGIIDAWYSFVSIFRDSVSDLAVELSRIAEYFSLVKRGSAETMAQTIQEQRAAEQKQEGAARATRIQAREANATTEAKKVREQFAKILGDRSRMQDTFRSQRELRDANRNQPNAELEAKKQEIAAKSKELAALSKRAKDLPPIPSLSLPEFQLPDLEIADRSLSKVSATGIFTGFAARSIGGDFGTGSPMERTARATEKTAKNTDAIKKQGGGAFTP
jgi:hypothetical protein